MRPDETLRGDANDTLQPVRLVQAFALATRRNEETITRDQVSHVARLPYFGHMSSRRGAFQVYGKRRNVHKIRERKANKISRFVPIGGVCRRSLVTWHAAHGRDGVEQQHKFLFSISNIRIILIVTGVAQGLKLFALST